jgi:hypothetical protein
MNIILIVAGFAVSALVIYYCLKKRKNTELCTSLVYDHRQGLLNSVKAMKSDMIATKKDNTDNNIGWNEILKELNTISGMLTQCEPMANYYITYKKVLVRVSNILDIHKNYGKEIRDTVVSDPYNYDRHIKSLKTSLEIDSVIPSECK